MKEVRFCRASILSNHPCSRGPAAAAIVYMLQRIQATNLKPDVYSNLTVCATTLGGSELAEQIPAYPEVEHTDANDSEGNPPLQSKEECKNAEATSNHPASSTFDPSAECNDVESTRSSKKRKARPEDTEAPATATVQAQTKSRANVTAAAAAGATATEVSGSVEKPLRKKSKRSLTVDTSSELSALLRSKKPNRRQSEGRAKDSTAAMPSIPKPVAMY